MATQTETTSRTQELLDSVRKMSLAKQLIPMEASIGWPIPVRKDGRVYLTLPFYGSHRGDQPGTLTLFPPFATVTLDWSNGRPVEYVNLRFRNPWPEGDWTSPAGTVPHPGATGKAGLYLERRAELLALYDELCSRLASGQTFDAAWTERFGALLRQMVEPPLEAYYRALGPKFFERFLDAGK